VSKTNPGDYQRLEHEGNYVYIICRPSGIAGYFISRPIFHFPPPVDNSCYLGGGVCYFRLDKWLLENEIHPQDSELSGTTSGSNTRATSSTSFAAPPASLVVSFPAPSRQLSAILGVEFAIFALIYGYWSMKLTHKIANCWRLPAARARGQLRLHHLPPLRHRWSRQFTPPIIEPYRRQYRRDMSWSYRRGMGWSYYIICRPSGIAGRFISRPPSTIRAI